MLLKNSARKPAVRAKLTAGPFDTKVSSPLPPFNVSNPPPPYKVSLPSLPLSTSLPTLPTMLLLPELPTPVLAAVVKNRKFSTLLPSV